ncbi:MAG: hypothetical protein KIG94_06685 [Acetatifactor sp.]|nr:hypothetical protein [Acetatifactor sp.]
MADITNYSEGKEKWEKKHLNYREQISRHKAHNFYRILLVLFLFVAIILLIYVQYNRHVYTGYDVTASVERDVVSGLIDCRLGNSVLSYSKDGVHCTDAKGKVTWNQTYEIQDIRMARNGGTVAMGDYLGRSIFVQNTEKQISEITTTMPLIDLTVSQEGYVTAILDGADSTFIETYGPDGKVLYEGETHMNNSGFPTALSLTPGGKMLAVSFWYVDAGELNSTVVFYGFDSVGENQNDFMVSKFTYPGSVMPMVQFVSDDTAFAVADNRIMLYKGKYYPEEKATRLFDEELQSVFFGDRYVGLVYRSEDVSHLYRMDVYDTAAVKAENFFLKSFYLDIEYTDIFLGEDTFGAYNETDCVIYTYRGMEKFNGQFDKPVKLMIPQSNSYKYLLVTEDSFDTIQLK